MTADWNELVIYHLILNMVRVEHTKLHQKKELCYASIWMNRENAEGTPNSVSATPL